MRGAGARWPCRARPARVRGRGGRPSPSRRRGARTGRAPRPGTASPPRSRCRSGRRARPGPARAAREVAPEQVRRHREGVRAVGGAPEPPLAPRRQPPGRPGLFGRFPGTMSRSNFLWSVRQRRAAEAFPLRPGGAACGRTRDLPVPAQMVSWHACGLGPRRAGAHLDHHGARRGGLPLLWDGPLLCPAALGSPGPEGRGVRAMRIAVLGSTSARTAAAWSAGRGGTCARRCRTRARWRRCSITMEAMVAERPEKKAVGRRQRFCLHAIQRRAGDGVWRCSRQGEDTNALATREQCCRGRHAGVADAASHDVRRPPRRADHVPAARGHARGANPDLSHVFRPGARANADGDCPTCRSRHPAWPS